MEGKIPTWVYLAGGGVLVVLAVGSRGSGVTGGGYSAGSVDIYKSQLAAQAQANQLNAQQQAQRLNVVAGLLQSNQTYMLNNATLAAQKSIADEQIAAQKQQFQTQAALANTYLSNQYNLGQQQLQGQLSLGTQALSNQYSLGQQQIGLGQQALSNQLALGQGYLANQKSAQDASAALQFQQNSMGFFDSIFNALTFGLFKK